MQKLRTIGLIFLPLFLILPVLSGDAIDALRREKPAESAPEKPPQNDEVAPSPEEEIDEPPAPRTEGPLSVYVVPIQDEISRPNEYILRRSVKEGIENEIDILVLDMDTPGGRLDMTLDMMEMIERFPGDTITYVNQDAISAGAYISMVTDSIYFAPNGVMGAAAVVSSGGQEIDESMKAKINSYLQARMRSYTEEHPYRSELIRAMADLDYELKIDGEVLKKPGELLSLTATESVKRYGNPPQPLLAHGVAEDIHSLLVDRYGEGNFTMKTFEITWSEELAKYLTSISPILLGLGMLALFVEFKTPGFGIAGIAGIVLIAVVFASNYLAGLAGMEGLLFFILGLILVVVDIFLLPGTFVFLIIGLVCIFGSLLWSLSDIWPTLPDSEGIGYTFDPDSMWAAFYEILGGFAIAFIGLALIWKLLPKTSIYGRIVHQSAISDPDPYVTHGGSASAAKHNLPDIGSIGEVTRPLHPLGEVTIDGERYQATVSVGSLDRGETVIVTGYGNFALIVARKEGSA